ncbi:MAG: sialidase family protein [Thermoplasmata archaeon]
MRTLIKSIITSIIVIFLLFDFCSGFKIVGGAVDPVCVSLETVIESGFVNTNAPYYLEARNNPRVYAFNEDTWYFITRDNFNQTYTTYTTNGGLTWTTNSSTQTSVYRILDLKVFTFDLIYFVTSEDPYCFFKTVNRGLTWEKINVGGPVNGAHILDQNTIIASYGSKYSITFRKTTDGGLTWSSTVVDIFTGWTDYTVSVSDIYASDINKYYMIWQLSDPFAGFTYFRLYRTTNGGSTWTRISDDIIASDGTRPAYEDIWTDILITDGDTLFVFDSSRYGGSGRNSDLNLFESTDGGFTWVRYNIVPSCVYKGGYANWMSVAKYGNIIKVVYTQWIPPSCSAPPKLDLATSDDGGVTWFISNVDNPSNHGGANVGQVNSISNYEKSYVITYTVGSQIWATGKSVYTKCK